MTEEKNQKKNILWHMNILWNLDANVQKLKFYRHIATSTLYALSMPVV